MENDTLDIARLITRTNQLLEALLRIQLEPIMKEEFKIKGYLKLYELTASGANTIEISKSTGLAVGTVSRVRQRWVENGMLIKDGRDFKTLL